MHGYRISRLKAIFCDGQHRIEARACCTLAGRGHSHEDNRSFDPGVDHHRRERDSRDEHPATAHRSGRQLTDLPSDPDAGLVTRLRASAADLRAFAR